MRVVVSNSEVAHLWANQAQNHAKNSNGSLYFHNETIYSYGHHFPIADIVTNEAGETAILFTTRGYSNTTAKQISIVRMAANHNIIYCYNPLYTFHQNCEEERKEAEYILQNLKTARKPEKYLMQLQSIADRVQKYADFKNMSIPSELQAVLNVASKSEYLEYLENKNELIKKAAAKKLAAEKKAYKATLKKWLSGKTDRLYSRIDNLDYLRVKNDTVETSQDIRMTIDQAKQLQTALKADLIEAGQTVLTHYSVKSVDQKFVVIGCHRFKRTYLENFKLV